MRVVSSLGARLVASVLFGAVLLGPREAAAAERNASVPTEAAPPDYVYRARRGDTLIGLAQRALIDPRRWPALQARNRIANPRALPIGSEIRIPASWLKQSPRQVEVLQVIGGVTSRGAPLAAGQRLDEGAVIETAGDGYATLRTAEGGVVVLQSSSRIVLERIRRYDGIAAHDTRMRLEAGAANSSVTPGGEVGRFEIATPVAVSAVRGTEFRTRFDANATLSSAEVTRGAVQVAGVSGGSVQLPQGFGTTTDATGMPAPPLALLPAPTLVDPPRQFASSTVQLTVAPLPGAQAYRAQLARDADMQLVIGEVRATPPEVRFESVPDGEYFVRVLGIGERGLEGFATTHGFSVLALLAPPMLLGPAPGGKQSGTSATFKWASVASAKGYEMQLARDTAFAESLGPAGRVSGDSWSAEGLTPGRYYWRVAAVHSSGARGEWSDAATFVQKALPQPPAVAYEPASGVRAAWPGEAGQTFKIQIAADAAFKSVRLEEVAVEPVMAARKLGPGNYWVRVQATDADGYVGPWSAGQPVTVPAPGWIKWLPLVSLLPLLL